MVDGQSNASPAGIPSDPLIADLVERCLLRPQDSWGAAVDAVCQLYPEHAEAIRRRFAEQSTTRTRIRPATTGAAKITGPFPERPAGATTIGIDPERDRETQRLSTEAMQDSGWGGGRNTGSLVKLRPADAKSANKLPAGIAAISAHADGFTLFLFQQELYRRYRALQQHAPWPEAPQAALYAHFALTEFDAASAANTVYWTGLLDRNPQGASLQDRAEHLESDTRAAGLVTLESSPLHSAELSEGCRRLGITLTQLVSCAVALLTYRLTLRSMPIQMVYNLRDRVAFETVLGDFSSSAPLLLSIEPGMKIRQLFEAYQEALLAIQTHKRFDFVELIGRMAGTETWSGISIDSNNRDSLCEVTDFASRLIDIPIEGREPVAPLVVCLVQTGGRLDLQLIYDRSRLSTRTMQLFAQAVNDLLPAMIADPDQPAGSLPVPQELLLRLAGNTNRPEPERPLTARVAVDRTA